MFYEKQMVFCIKENKVGEIVKTITDKKSQVMFKDDISTSIIVMDNKNLIDFYVWRKKKLFERKWEIVSDEFRKHPNVEIKLPQKATKSSVGYDFYSPCDVVLEPFKPTLIMTDVKCRFMPYEALLLNVRSSMGKIPVIMSNNQGWIEADYYSNPDNDGNLGFYLLNLSKEPYEIKQGDRIGQGMLISKIETDNGNSDNERVGGFGSTGK